MDEKPCDGCGWQAPAGALHYCRGCGAHLCRDCWEEQAYRAYELCAACGLVAARDDYWEHKLEEERERGRRL